MEVERIEEWIGREVLGADGEKLGKLKQVYYRGDEPEVGEVKPGALTRKRLYVPLAGATFARETITGGSSSEDHDLTGLEAADAREARLAELAEAEAEAARLRVDAEDAAARAREAEEASRLAQAKLDRLRNRAP